MTPLASWAVIGLTLAFALNATWLLVAFIAWLDERLPERDNAPACLEARGDVSTDSAKETM